MQYSWSWIFLLVLPGIIFISFIIGRLTAPGFQVEGKHVFITGGSSGLGLSVAKKYAKAGAKISIIARRQEQLKAVQTEIEACLKNPTNQIFIQSCDVTDFINVQEAVKAANQFHGCVTDHIVCCAGITAPSYFLDQDVDTFHQVMDTNYFGALHVVKAALPAMVERDEGGQIVFVSSGLGLISWIGFTQYSASKYALRGLAEGLRNELKLYNIGVNIFYPGNIDTPMFEKEHQMTPPETKIIEGVSAAVHPDRVAQSLINGISRGEFNITNDRLIFILRILTNGVTPRINTVLEAVLLPFAIIIQVAFGYFIDTVVTKSRQENLQKQSTSPANPYISINVSC